MHPLREMSMEMPVKVDVSWLHPSAVRKAIGRRAEREKQALERARNFVDGITVSESTGEAAALSGVAATAVLAVFFAAYVLWSERRRGCERKDAAASLAAAAAAERERRAS